MMIVKTWSESTKETEDYLKYNGYGNKITRIPTTDFYICTGKTNKINLLKDVGIIMGKIK